MLYKIIAAAIQKVDIAPFKYSSTRNGFWLKSDLIDYHITAGPVPHGKSCIAITKHPHLVWPLESDTTVHHVRPDTFAAFFRFRYGILQLALAVYAATGKKPSALSYLGGLCWSVDAGDFCLGTAVGGIDDNGVVADVRPNFALSVDLLYKRRHISTVTHAVSTAADVLPAGRRCLRALRANLVEIQTATFGPLATLIDADEASEHVRDIT